MLSPFLLNLSQVLSSEFLGFWLHFQRKKWPLTPAFKIKYFSAALVARRHVTFSHDPSVFRFLLSNSAYNSCNFLIATYLLRRKLDMYLYLILLTDRFNTLVWWTRSFNSVANSSIYTVLIFNNGFAPVVRLVNTQFCMLPDWTFSSIS